MSNYLATTTTDPKVQDVLEMLINGHHLTVQWAERQLRLKRETVKLSPHI
jgi:hypothetical protein